MFLMLLVIVITNICLLFFKQYKFLNVKTFSKCFINIYLFSYLYYIYIYIWIIYICKYILMYILSTWILSIFNNIIFNFTLIKLLKKKRNNCTILHNLYVFNLHLSLYVHIYILIYYLYKCILHISIIQKCIHIFNIYCIYKYIISLRVQILLFFSEASLM